jgi:hypothetical protein
MEGVMRHFYQRALIEQRMGPQADWSVVDALMLKTLAAAEKVARYKHAQLSMPLLTCFPSFEYIPLTVWYRASQFGQRKNGGAFGLDVSARSSSLPSSWRADRPSDWLLP